MKIKNPLILSVICLTLSLSACQGQARETAAAYIGIDAAKNAALAAAGISSADASFSTAGLDNRDGTFFYQINFTAGGAEYEYAVDAFTGVIIEGTSPESAEVSETDFPDNGSADTVSEESAAGDAAPEESSPDESAQAVSSAPAEETSSSGILDGAEALNAALTHAGVAEADAQKIQVKRDYEHDSAIYKIEFRTADQGKYEYKIDASTGAIISYDYEQDNDEQKPAPSGSAILSEEEIRRIVQERVPGAPAENIFLHLDEDDGRMEYEGTLLYDNMEYEFKIDACSGSVIEWEAERTDRKWR